jgi:hypothetical protein
VLKAQGSALTLNTLRFASEIRPVDELSLPVNEKLASNEVNLAMKHLTIPRLGTQCASRLEEPKRKHSQYSHRVIFLKTDCIQTTTTTRAGEASRGLRAPIGT